MSAVLAILMPMEMAALIVAFGVLVVSGVAAAAAVVQARAANNSRIDAQAALLSAQKARDEAQELARTATAAFVRSAAAQEHANVLKEQELAVPAWTHQWVSGDMFRILNTSKRRIKVDRIDIQPDGTENTVIIAAANESGIYEYGDVIEYLLSKRMGGNAKKLTVFWGFEDEPDEPESAFIIAL